MNRKTKNSGALAEERVRKLNRVYEVLSAMNHLVIRAADKQTLFEGACRILVETGLGKEHHDAARREGFLVAADLAASVPLIA